MVPVFEKKVIFWSGFLEGLGQFCSGVRDNDRYDHLWLIICPFLGREMSNMSVLSGSGRFRPKPFENWTKSGQKWSKTQKSQFDFFRGGKCIHWGVAFLRGHILDHFLDRFFQGPSKLVILVIFDRNMAFSSYIYRIYGFWPISGKTVKKGSKKGSQNRTPKKVRKNG